VYDDAMKVLADDDLDAVLSVVGVHGVAQRLNVELAGSAVRADLLARTAGAIVHVEFVKDAAPDLDLRMVDYRTRVRRTDRHTPIAQYVLVLGDDVTVPDRYDDVDAGRSVFGWTVVRLADLDPVPLLSCPTTAAIAALARGTLDERAEGSHRGRPTDREHGSRSLPATDGRGGDVGLDRAARTYHWHSVEGGSHARSGT